MFFKSGLERRLQQAGDVLPAVPAGPTARLRSSPKTDRLDQGQAEHLKMLIPLARQKIEREFTAHDLADRHAPAVRQKVKRVVGQLIEETLPDLPKPAIISLVEDIVDDLLGYGPLEPFFTGPGAEYITEIIVRKFDQIMIERDGKAEVAMDDRGQPAKFRDEQHVRDVLERMLAPTGRRIDLACPTVGARLPDGSRLQAAIPPIAVEGTQITIRRFRQDVTAALLLENKALNEEMLEFLKACVRARLNIFVSGGTGSGKTALLNVLASFIPEEESIITVEDPAELQLQHANVRRLEARPSNVEGKGEITQRDLVAMTLRMAPKRIIVGECRQGEAFDMLQAMNTGHNGSMSTGHANSAYDMVNARLPSMVQMAIDLKRETVLQMIASAVDLVVHLQKDRDGVRQVEHICEVQGLEKRADSGDFGVKLVDIYTYKKDDDIWVRTEHPFARQQLIREFQSDVPGRTQAIN